MREASVEEALSGCARVLPAGACVLRQVRAAPRKSTLIEGPVREGIVFCVSSLLFWCFSLRSVGCGGTGADVMLYRYRYIL